MDLEIMAQVQTNIIGNCLCVLGDSMAMPVGSMIEKFRAEFEAHMEAGARTRDGRAERRRSRTDRAAVADGGRRRAWSSLMPRPEPKIVTFEIDGREVRAPEGTMLVDGAKYGDVEIPVLLLRAEARPARSAPAACASSRSRASRSCRPPARRR